MVNELLCAGRRIGAGHPCFIIAEAGVNHDGDPVKAMALVAAAADAGADAVKFQTFRAESLVTASARKAEYQVATTGGGESQLAMLRRLELGPEVFRALKRAAEERGLVFLSTPFDSASAQLLCELEVPAFKLASGEVTNLPFLAEIAACARPVILSTGMSTLVEVEAAVATIRAAGNPALAILHCVSAYPAPPAQYNLRAMATMRAALDLPVGLSDHSLGWEVSLAGIALGAVILEKHLTLSRVAPGPDHAASLEPAEFAALVRQARSIESALGDGIKRAMPCEADTRAVARKSVVARRDLPIGSRLTADDLVIKRPGTGISPADLARVIGSRLTRGAQADQPLTWEHLG